MSETGIDALELAVGRDSSIGERAIIGAIGGPARRVVIGDNVQIGPDVRILAPEVEIGDWTVLHHHTTIYGYAPVRIGSCCWVGQNATLNCTDELELNRGVTFGAYSAVYTHSSGGDIVQGFKFLSRKPALLEEDSFIAPHCVIAPVQIGARAMVLAGSVVTRDVPPNTTWGGSPAQDLTAKLGAPYADLPLEAKYAHLLALLRQFAAGEPVSESAGSASCRGVTITMASMEHGDTPVFDIRNRSYSKLRTVEELAFMRFLLPAVKFYPRGL